MHRDSLWYLFVYEPDKYYEFTMVSFSTEMSQEECCDTKKAWCNFLILNDSTFLFYYIVLVLDLIRKMAEGWHILLVPENPGTGLKAAHLAFLLALLFLGTGYLKSFGKGTIFLNIGVIVYPVKERLSNSYSSILC